MCRRGSVWRRLEMVGGQFPVNEARWWRTGGPQSSSSKFQDVQKCVSRPSCLITGLLLVSSCVLPQRVFTVCGLFDRSQAWAAFTHDQVPETLTVKNTEVFVAQQLQKSEELFSKQKTGPYDVRLVRPFFFGSVKTVHGCHQMLGTISGDMRPSFWFP